jgi:hypothetical protein
MSKWHKITGSYHSLLIIDPQQLENPLVVNIQAKHEILARNLLQNSAKARDTPLDTPAVPLRSL